MRKTKPYSITVLSVFFLFLLAQCTGKPENKKEWLLGLQPNEETKDVSALEAKLRSKSKLPLRVVISSSYQETVEQLKTGKLDFAVLSPLNLVLAEREMDLKVLLKKIYGNSEFYYSAILVAQKSKIKTLKDLKGKKIAFVDLKSASGHLYPHAMLKHAGVDWGEIEAKFLGTHVKAVEALLKGEVDAAAVWADEPGTHRGAWTEPEIPAAQQKLVRVLKFSEPIPNDGIVVRAAIHKDQPEGVLRFMDAFIELSDDPEKILKDVFGVDKLTTATSRHYDVVRELADYMKEDKH
jgi:phosphonate transport system substrate-binding protein